MGFAESHYYTRLLAFPPSGILLPCILCTGIQSPDMPPSQGALPALHPLRCNPLLEALLAWRSACRRGLLDPAAVPLPGLSAPASTPLPAYRAAFGQWEAVTEALQVGCEGAVVAAADCMRSWGGLERAA